ncbi:hypothetical protein EQW78_03045 [Oerskovia turbata]|uniref:SGNH/GDSL hydrolase family protein n=1 Tax=Oerskovia turbata TaxID=1713 RepID=A0A4Q1L2R2_9CELL|nr:DUF6270 domain-containing protein [Oerskovia turbata]RXR26901.1 hypothetical protein EQW73_05380 [Oerskovia turbata]RXR36257.1 hypothetical protein EQW78_03045 [Oerskovia turbata]
MRSVLIHGSCVTRDAFALPGESRFRLTDYYARSSLASAFADHGLEGVDTTTLPSAFQRRMVEQDLGKAFWRAMPAVQADVIVVDLVDERFGILVDDRAGVGTPSAELLRAGVSPDLHRVVPGSIDFLMAWEAGRRRFVAEARAAGLLDRIVVHQARWAEQCADGTRFDYKASADANHLLEYMYGRLRLDLAPHQFVRVPVHLVVGDPDHRWGRSPVHYVEGYYRSFLDLLDRATASPRQ